MAQETEPSEIADDDLITSWALAVDGLTRTQQRILDDVAEPGVPGQWFAVLHILLSADEHRLPMSRLARDLSMTSGGFTKLADRMASEGLIDRRGSSGDRRVVYASLTTYGMEVAERSVRRYLEALRTHVVGVLSAARLRELAEILRTLSGTHTDGADPDDMVLTERDPALPDRRGRGRPRN